jgi:tRNA modification GTPase
MLNNDIIVAVSSAAVGAGQTGRSIVRLSGTGVWGVLEGVVAPLPAAAANTVVPCRVQAGSGPDIDAVLYCFRGPGSYTGEDMAELHLWAAAEVVEQLLRLLCERARLAGPGEFTLRAYLNGKMDLTQAEAVAQIVSSANTFQLAAAEKLLHGKFSATIAAVRAEVLDLLSLIEAGLDFTEEDIEFIAAEDAAARIIARRDLLQGLLDGSVRLERMIDLDAVGLAGLPNAGKSSLLNALLGTQRSLVSPVEATTRDILTGVLDLSGVSCVLFDCAGLLPDVTVTESAEDESAWWARPTLPMSRREAVDRLAHQAAVDALRQAEAVLFCIDAEKTSFEAELRILSQVQTKTLLPVITKADLADAAAIGRLEAQMKDHFAAPFCITSARTGAGLADLKGRIENALISGRSGDAHADRLTLNRRHQERIEDAVKTLGLAADELQAGRDDTASMLLRQSYETLGGLERENVSEKILDSIFSRFCIGK